MKKDSKIKEEELVNDLKRVQADFINYKNRVDKEKENYANHKLEQFILEILEILDNLELSLKNNKDEGITLIHKQFLDILNKNQIKKILENKEFNPEFHEAIEKEDGNKILEIIKQGYTFNDKTIRPTKVKVGGGKQK